MSSLAQFISKEFVVLPMLATDMGTAIEELLEPLRQHKILALDEHCAEGVLKRERRMSTGVGKGVALPQGLSDQVSDVALVIGISPAGIDFKAVDGMLCHIIVLFIGPAAQPDKHHKVLSRFTHLLSDGELRSALIESQTVDNVIEILAGWDREDDEEGL